MKLFQLLFVVLFTCTLSCSHKLQPPSAEVSFLHSDAPGSITVRSKGYGNNRESATIDAQENAFRVIMFRGIPGTEVNVPLIENESEVRKRHQSYLNHFFHEKGYLSFMMSSNPSSGLMKEKRRVKIDIDIKININSLRKELEQHSVIRKFGF